MRNLLVYPITLEEKIKVLEDLRAQLQDLPLIGDIRPVVLSLILDDLRPTPAPEPAPVEPAPEPGDIIAGPRIPLRYGSAATCIRLSTREWRQVERGPRPWIAIDDYTHAENLTGKRVSFAHGGAVVGIVEPAVELDDLFQVCVDGDARPWSFDSADDITILHDEVHLNPFECVIFGHKAEGLDQPKDAEVTRLIHLAQQCRHDMKRRIARLGGDFRATLLAEFGWTEDDLKEVQ